MNAIEVRNLGRTYRTTTGLLRRKSKDVLGLDDVSFCVAPGELFGLLGPNGAGKTTTVKILITLLIPTAGTASVLGYDVVQDVKPLRPRIGFVLGGERGLYWRLSGYDNLVYFANLYRLSPAVRKRRIPYLQPGQHFTNHEQRYQAAARIIRGNGGIEMADLVMHAPRTGAPAEPPSS